MWVSIAKYMSKQFYKDAFGWGFLLWFIGFFLGMVLFLIVPVYMIGWIISPIGLVITILVLIKKILGNSLKYYFLMALIWTFIAVVLDYIFLVKMFALSDGYYKLDVYLYYTLTFLLPIIVGWYKTKSLIDVTNQTLKHQDHTK
jgi:hypothetical protein